MKLLALVTLLATVALTPRGVADITLTPGTTYQVMRGWEATAPGWRFTTQAFMQQVVDRGVNRLRVEVGAHIENSTDYLAAFYANETACPNYPTVECEPSPTPGETPEGDALTANRYVVVNDNGDPNSTNAAGFQFTGLDDAMDRTVVPMRTMLSARGESLYVNLCYVAFSNADPAKNEVHKDPDEYAEFMLAIFAHLSATYGFVPNGVEIILEPDNSQLFWGSVPGSPQLMGEIIKATGDRLAAAGYTPDFIMPGTTSYASVSTYVNGAQLVTGAMAYVDEMSFHAYNQTGGTASVAADSADAGVCSSMLEWWTASNTYSFMHDLLANGNMCAYQRGVVYPQSEEDYYPYLQQYFRPVRRGATRIAASSTNGALDPLAFINTNGAYAVVIKATSAQSFTVGNLPTATYHVRYTTGAETDTNAGDQAITAGNDLSTSIPAAGVIAIYAEPVTTSRAPVRVIRGGQ